MNINNFRRPDPAAQYAAQRLESRRDDRTSQEKLDADARLRGKLGERRANAIIEAVDNLKMRGLA